MPRCVPFAQVVNAIGFAVNNMDKALFFRGVILRGDVCHAKGARIPPNGVQGLMWFFTYS
ncbi:hypothetical protein HMPREF9080_00696 [Cardiobacterium valvarum F0432]|uniref:Uncharacterized protein n=1 Tax=Cardiobacterium valvarum F0432 TaxID=797473 RepID=G9ZD62_9GAMM|nr:hypothetical protein HMPREF9080_00696 [Cardiobacterium valvarum F0432]